MYRRVALARTHAFSFTVAWQVYKTWLHGGQSECCSRHDGHEPLNPSISYMWLHAVACACKPRLWDCARQAAPWPAGPWAADAAGRQCLVGARAELEGARARGVRWVGCRLLRRADRRWKKRMMGEVGMAMQGAHSVSSWSLC